MLSSPLIGGLVIVYFENMYINGFYLLGYIKEEDSFLPLQLQSLRLPVVHIKFWFNVYSIIKVFSSTTIFVERIFGLEDLFLNYISPTVLWFVWSAQVTEGRGKDEATEGKLKARARKSVMLHRRLYSIGHEELWRFLVREVK